MKKEELKKIREALDIFYISNINDLIYSISKNNFNNVDYIKIVEEAKNIINKYIEELKD